MGIGLPFGVHVNLQGKVVLDTNLMHPLGALIGKAHGVADCWSWYCGWAEKPLDQLRWFPHVSTTEGRTGVFTR